MVSTRRPIMAGNWKMYKTTAEAKDFVTALAGILAGLKTQQLPEVVLCPSFTLLAVTQKQGQEAGLTLHVAAQTMDSHAQGAYTGEVSVPMLLDLGVKWVVLGHSERRQYFNETDLSVAEKMKAALAADMTPIVCVGEDLLQREAEQTDHVIEAQLKPVLDTLKECANKSIVIAYEPVWAIGTGKVCDAAEAARVCGFIRKQLESLNLAESTRILYGGSVKPDNVEKLMSYPDIDGALVGGASLEAESFGQLVQKSSLAAV